MSDFSLVPVEHQPEFENYSLVPVEHDPFAGDGETQQAESQQAQIPIQPPQSQPQVQRAQFQRPSMGASQSSAPTLGMGTTESIGPHYNALTEGASDFFRSTPRGIVSGLNSAGT